MKIIEHGNKYDKEHLIFKCRVCNCKFQIEKGDIFEKKFYYKKPSFILRMLLKLHLYDGNDTFILPYKKKHPTENDYTAAIFVFCPECNGIGYETVYDSTYQDFTKRFYIIRVTDEYKKITQEHIRERKK